MSDDRHSHIDNEDEEDSGFYQKSEESSQNKDAENIPSKNDAFKHKPIHKRKKGHQKQKNSKQEQKQRKMQQNAQIQAQAIIDQMQKTYDEDRKLYEKRKPASKKLFYLKQLSNKLKNLLVWDKFLQLGGLSQFELWFSKLPQGTEPSLTLRKGLLQILDSLRIKSEHISKVSSIQRIVQKHKKSQTKQLRQLSESILLKWSKTLHEQEIQG